MTSLQLQDTRAEYPTTSQVLLRGPVVSVTNDHIEFHGHSMVRQVVRHPGAVAVVALRDTSNGPEILLVRQYRHPVRRFLWELPAGLCDEDGEALEDCARRELREETGYRAVQLEQLVVAATSPGGSDEIITLFVTWDPEPDSETVSTDEPEELHMDAAWFPLAQALQAVRSGRVLNGTAQLGIALAALRVRQPG